VSERGARVPLIVRCPGTVQAGVVSGELADLTDVLPTLAEMGGARIPGGHIIDGVSLAPTLRGEPGEHRPWIFSFRGTALRLLIWYRRQRAEGFTVCARKEDADKETIREIVIQGI